MFRNILVTMVAITLCGCSTHALDRQNLLTALRRHFAGKGKTICTDQFSLPATQDVTYGGANAQLIALSKVGLVSVKERVTVEAFGMKTSTDSYALTPVARTSANVHIGKRSDWGTGVEQHYTAFCYGTITPEKVSNIQKQQGPPIPGLNDTFVSADYSYSVDVRPWATNPSVRKAFPSIDDVVTNPQRTATAQFTQDANKDWVVQSDGLQGGVR
uniref:Lipoprotein n=1 Tax=mine drainage metagenome TaxID=410659 RepID=E6Q2T3_9ZZZZ